MKGRWVRWSDEELAWIGVWRDLPRAELHRRFVAIWNRPDVSEENIRRLCIRNGWLTGRTGCFEKGIVPHNKGKPNPGAHHPAAVANRFKPGQLSGQAARLLQPIGAERIADGYRERKLRDDGPPKDRWRAIHRIEWEAVNGPVPAGMALKCLDGDRTNCDPANWELVPRALLPRLNGRFGRGYDTAPPALKPAILAVARLEHAVAEASS